MAGNSSRVASHVIGGATTKTAGSRTSPVHAAISLAAPGSIHSAWYELVSNGSASRWPLACRNPMLNGEPRGVAASRCARPNGLPAKSALSTIQTSSRYAFANAMPNDAVPIPSCTPESGRTLKPAAARASMTGARAGTMMNMCSTSRACPLARGTTTASKVRSAMADLSMGTIGLPNGVGISCGPRTTPLPGGQTRP